jgi:LmbE family N-acetylglucosaminyl deacetylase
MKVLVVAAHPDDEVLGCGGAIYSLQKSGHEVRVLILAEGQTSRGKNRNALSELHKNAATSAKILGIKHLHLEKLPDNRMDELALMDVIKVVEFQIEKYRPYLIFTHHPGDLNIDHGITFRAVITAARPMEESSVQAVMTFEVPSSTEWSFQQIGPVFQPNYFIDVTKSLDKKLAAMKAYKSELRNFPHPRSLEVIQASAIKWGASVGMNAAEAFQIIWSKLQIPGEVTP